MHPHEDFLNKLIALSPGDLEKFIDILQSGRLPILLEHGRHAAARHSKALADGTAAAEGDPDPGTGGSCKVCDPIYWDSDIARWLYCGPLGLGCIS